MADLLTFARALTMGFALLASPAWAGGGDHAAPPAVDFADLPAEAQARPVNPNGKPHQAMARLLADRSAVHPGESFRLGVQLVPDKKWHSYWKSPGDIGMPLTLEWSLPEGTEVPPHEYPVPQRFDDSGVISYGYDGPVLVFSDVALPATQSPGTVRAEVKASWLVCESICVPGEVTLALPLEVVPADAATEAAPWAPLFDHYAARHPTPYAKVHAIGVEGALSQTAYRPGDPFEVAFLVTPTGEEPVEIPVEASTWPAFAPIVDSYQIFLYESAITPLDDGSALIVLKGDALELEELPKDSRVGGLFQAKVDGQLVQTEYSIPVPWVPAGTEVEKSGSVLWTLAGGEVPDLPVAPEVPAPLEAAAPAAQGIGWMLALALLGGMLLNVMPCVFPVITLKLFSLCEHAGASTGERRMKAVAYTAGILVSFWALAGAVVLAKATIGGVGWGFQFQSPTYVAVLATIVFLFGLSLFGVFEIPVIGGDAAARASSSSGLAGDFANGVFATLLATPCSAPFLGTAIGFAFAQPTSMVLLFFTVIGLGLALPFVAVAFIPALFQLIPRPGPWMETFKQFLGFTLVATAIWLVDVLADQVGSDAAIGFLAFLGTASVGAWIFGRWGDVAQSGQRQLGALAVGTAVAFGGGWTFLDLSAVPEEECVDDSALSEVVWDGEEIPWQPFSEERVGLLAGQPMFIDFTAKWCLTCKVNERTVLGSDEVREAMRDLGVVPLVADWTRRDEEITEWLARFGRAGVPFYLVIPADPSLDPIPLPEVITPGMVVGALQRAAAEG